MKNTILFLILSSILLSCGSSVRVSTDHDEFAFFNILKTYKWYERKELPPGVSTINHRRLVNAVNRELALDGYKIAGENEKADFLVNYAVVRKEKSQIRYNPPAYSGYSPYYYGRHYYPSYHSGGTARKIDYTEGTLFIDILFAKTNKLIWRGIGTRRIPAQLDAEKRKEIINEAAAEILAQFPPNPKDKPVNKD